VSGVRAPQPLSMKQRALGRFGVVGPPCDSTTHLGRSSTATNSWPPRLSIPSRLVPPLQHIPFLHHHLAPHLAALFPSKCHSTSTTTTALDHQFAAHGVKALVSKPCLYRFSQLDPSFVLPSPGPVTSFTPSSPADRRHRVALFVLGKGAPHSSLYF